MDHWQAHVARCDRPNAVDQWASLEAKNETMRADLVRRHTEKVNDKSKRTLTSALCFEVLLAALDTWLHARSR
jgi:hypothetical protein